MFSTLRRQVRGGGGGGGSYFFEELRMPVMDLGGWISRALAKIP
jgi:hypothetical protein